MIKMNRKWYCHDGGYMDVSDEIIEVDLPEGSSIEDVVIKYLLVDHIHPEEEEKTRELIESGKWYGGEWRLEDKNTLQFISDVESTEYSI